MDRAEPIDAVEAGEVIGGYRLERLLGAGAVSRVFLATHLRLGRRAAIKVLTPPLVDDERITNRFLAEARVVNGIRHPNIVDISDFIESTSPRRLALVMEHIEGPSLKKVVREGRPLSFVQAVGVMLQLADALGAAHAAGVIHRDLKPDNLLLTSEPDEDPSIVPGLKIVDFGIAKIGAWGDKTATGMMIGTPAYMAPEQIAGRPPPSSASDVYAFGELLYELLTRQRAYPVGAVGAVIQSKLKGELPKLDVPPVPGGVAILDAVRRCLAMRPQDRPRLDELTAMLVEICPDAEAALPRGAKKRPPSSEAETIEPPDRRASPATRAPAPVQVDRVEQSFVETIRPPSAPLIPAAPTFAAPIQSSPRAGDTASADASASARSVAAVAAHTGLATTAASPLLVPSDEAPIPGAMTIPDEAPPVETVTPVMPRPFAPSGDTITPLLTPPQAATSARADAHAVASIAMLSVATPSVATPSSATPSSATPSSATPSSATPSFATPTSRSAAGARRARAPLFVAAAVAIVGVGVVIGATLSREPEPRKTHTSSAQQATSGSQEPAIVPHARAEPTTSTQRVEVATTPDGARVEDAKTGALLGHTPLSFEARGGTPSAIRIRRDGYEPVELPLVGPHVRVTVDLRARATPAQRADGVDATEAPRPTSGAKARDPGPASKKSGDRSTSERTPPREEFPSW
ncbi:protein kinase [Myxococcota bacterium]|nr:protein kinase [Myxococcota bacterium]